MVMRHRNRVRSNMLEMVFSEQFAIATVAPMGIDGDSGKGWSYTRAPNGSWRNAADGAQQITYGSGTVGAKAFFVQGVTMLPWEPAIEVSKDGAVRATVGASGLPTLSPGRWELVVILARPEDVPADVAEARKVMASRERRGVLVLRRPIEVSP